MSVLSGSYLSALARADLSCSLLVERDGDEVEVEVYGERTKGCRATGPSYASGGEPGEPDGVEVIGAFDVDGREVELREPERARAERRMLLWRYA
jgi:hypothetical protein